LLDAPDTVGFAGADALMSRRASLVNCQFNHLDGSCVLAIYSSLAGLMKPLGRS
jgi:hypothetical protein